MDTSRLSQGQMIAAASGVVLIISLFLKWAGGDVASASGWKTQNTLDIYLFLLALIAIVPVAMGGEDDLPYLTTESKVLTSVIGLILMVFVVISGPISTLGADVNIDKGIGVWLAFLATIGIVIGQFQAMNQEAGR
jgi:UDP-N-acetylmuramyl pentapeptide phosphotransferase/UDP-N-acetylglucosamine-1-phosphate transferase